MSKTAGERVRTLLLRADNVLKNEGELRDRVPRAREALLQARAVADSPDVDERVRELVERRLAALEDLPS